MTKITAIPTRYAGRLFRSRLEARWAVFFDKMGLQWAYEIEGVILPSGKWYLPDFWLPQMGYFLEIKPPIPQDDDGGRKWPDHPVFNEGDYDSKLIAGDIQGDFALVAGQPHSPPDRSIYGDWGYEIFVQGDCSYRFCECPKCGTVGIEYDGRAARLCKCFPDSDRGHNIASPRLLAAYDAAMSWRPD